MNSEESLNEFEKTLDSLIQNARLLNQLHLDGSLDGAQASLQQRQEELLSDLFEKQKTMGNDLDAIRKSPSLYMDLEKKIHRFSVLSQHLLQGPKTRFVKKARVHRNRRSVR